MALYHTNVLDPQIKALPTVDTASGSIATFDTDMTENLIEVKCQIVAQQSGSGTPSPDNVRPIQTYDDLTLYHNNINLWNEVWELGTYSTSTGEKVAGNYNIRSKSYIKVTPNTLYRFITPANAFNVMCYDENKSYINFLGSPATFNTPPTCHYITFYLGSGYGTTYNHDTSINYPSTDTQYHAFNGAYIPFGQTVAKGTLNVSTGVLEITDGFDSFDLSQIAYTNLSGIDSWALTASQISTGGSDNVGKKCNINGVYSFSTTRYEHFYIQNNGIRVYFTENTARDKIAQFVYPLATPIEIQLNSNQITALLNENNIWCDTNGDTSVKYLLSVGKKIS